MLDFALIIGIILSLLNLGDFLLRPHQKRIIQDSLENFVLWLDYKRPLRLIFNIQSIRSWQIGIIGFLLLITTITYLATPRNEIVTRIGLFMIIYSFLLIGTAPFWNLAKSVLNINDSDKGINRLVLRSFGIVLAYLLVQFIYILSIAIFKTGALFSIIMLSILVLRFRWIIAYNAAVAVSIIALSSCFILLTLEALVRCVRFVGWRIIEYTNGASAAIILLITTALALFKLF